MSIKCFCLLSLLFISISSVSAEDQPFINWDDLSSPGYETYPYLLAAKGGGGPGGGVPQPPTTIITVNNLGFEPGIAGISQILVTQPSDFRAAVFEASGEAWGVVTITVVESNIFMTNIDTSSNADKIRVDQFQTGGNLDALGRGVFDQYGTLDDIRVGATAEVTSKLSAGDYRGSATLRLVYN